MQQKLTHTTLSNILGTTSNRFRLGKGGPWLSHGSEPPDDREGGNGDLYIRTGRAAALYVRRLGGWVRTNDMMMDFAADRFTATGGEISEDASYVGLRIAGGGTVALPTGVPPGKVIVVKDEGGIAADNPVIIVTTDGTRIDGERGVEIAANHGAITLLFNGINWVIAARVG